MNKVIKTSLAPEPIGTYSQAILAGNLLFSVQMGLSPITGKFAGEDIESQTRQTLENLKNILAEAGMTLGNVVKTTVFISDMNNAGKVNEIYGSYFTVNPPARATVEVNRLPANGLIEMEIIAVNNPPQ